MAIKRNPNTGKIIVKRFSLERIETAAQELAGFCIACGAEAERCDPDARRCRCESCGLPYVYGAEEIALMGLLR